MKTWRTIGVAIIALVTLGVIAFGLMRKSSRSGPGRAAIVERPHERFTVESVPIIAKELAKRAEAEWIASGIDQSLAGVLRLEVQNFIPVVAGAEYDRYESYMNEMGARLHDGRATKILRVYMAKKYASSSGIDWSNAPVGELARVVWAGPSLREATWTALDPSRVRAGQGWALDGAETAKGTAVSLTMFDIPDWDKLIQGAQRGDVAAAWVQFPVGFEQEAACEVRFTFVYHNGKERWMPLRVDVLGPYPKPFLLF